MNKSIEEPDVVGGGGALLCGGGGPEQPGGRRHATALPPPTIRRPPPPGPPRRTGPPKIANPVASTPESLAAGKRAYDTNCAACHGNMAQGAEKAGVVISIIAEQGGKQPPDLTDDQWDHGSTDGEIYTVIKRGVPPTMMAGWEGRVSDTEIWSIVNYLRALAAKKEVTRRANGCRRPHAASTRWRCRTTSRCRSPAISAESSRAACWRA